MMHAEESLEEIGMQLPSGFHDSYIEAIALDLLANTATLDLELWVGDLDAPLGPEREAYRRGRLRLNGLVYFVIEPPGPGGEWLQGDCGVRIEDDGEAKADHEKERLRPRAALSEKTIADWFFLHDWNSLLHIAARSADFEWTEEHADSDED